MDNSPQPATTTPPTTNSQSTFSTSAEKKHNSLKFVKIVLLFLLGILLLGGGYYIGNQTTTHDIKIVPPTEPTAMPIEELPSPTITTSGKTKTVKGGLDGETSFKPYTIQIPEGWVDAHETTVAASIDKLTLSKNGYTLIIYQAAVGGGGCLYPGDKTTDMATTFTEFKDIAAVDSHLRRSWNQPEAGAKVISYTICQKTPDNAYGNITGFGMINAVSPNPANPSILTEIDSMLASLKKD